MKNSSNIKIAISATFTAEPLEEFLDFWGRELAMPFEIEFAPYNQIFQQLLDPSSLFSNNKNGINIILLRIEDWQQSGALENHGTKSISLNQDTIEKNTRDLVQALKSSIENVAAHTLIFVCPLSPAIANDSGSRVFFKRAEELLADGLRLFSSVDLITTSELAATYPVDEYYDPHGNDLAHIPYTPLFFTSLAAMIARKIYPIKSHPYKVVVLDCDQTLWSGICGEDGPDGVMIDTPYKKLQEFMVEQHDAGMLLCLCSKNREEDVIDVFKHHQDMPLKQDYIISSRINWGSKSKNIESLAKELRLGLNSFMFVEDNPVESAEIKTNYPEVLTLLLPKNPVDIPEFLKHVWAFDHSKITDEDRKRTTLYKQNIKRENLRQKSLTLEEFLTGLELDIKITQATPNNFKRVEQLIQRTTQFNFTTIRHSKAEINRFCLSGELECLIVELKDRFGAYGIVGVILFKANSEAIKVDTFLLSCRALGRGVEYKMLAKLGEIASGRGLDYIDVIFTPTKRNQPALDFLDIIGSKHKISQDKGWLYHLPKQDIKNLTYAPGSKEPMRTAKFTDAGSYSFPSSPDELTDLYSESEKLGNIAENLNNAEKILKKIESMKSIKKSNLLDHYIAPRNNVEQSIAGIWQDVLRLEKMSINVNFFDLGGHSLLLVQVYNRLLEVTDRKISITDLFRFPTIKKLADFLSQSENKESATEKMHNRVKGHNETIIKRQELNWKRRKKA